jgi:hypothetical protein
LPPTHGGEHSIGASTSAIGASTSPIGASSAAFPASRSAIVASIDGWSRDVSGCTNALQPEAAAANEASTMAAKRVTLRTSRQISGTCS